MTSKDIIDTINTIITQQDVSIASVARRMGKSSQALNRQLNGNNMQVNTLLDIIDALHCNIEITITDKATDSKYKVQSK